MLWSLPSMARFSNQPMEETSAREHQDSRSHGEHRSWVAPFSLFLVLLVMDCFLNCKRKASSSLQPGCPSSRGLSKSQKELHDQPAIPDSPWEKVEFGGFCFFLFFGPGAGKQVTFSFLSSPWASEQLGEGGRNRNNPFEKPGRTRL